MNIILFILSLHGNSLRTYLGNPEMNLYVSNTHADNFIRLMAEKTDIDYSALSGAQIKSRIRRLIIEYRLNGIDDLFVLLDKNDLQAGKIVYDFGFTYRELFRDPIFLKQFRKRVNPMVKSLEKIRIWVPDCGNGTEAYTLAVVLFETEAFEKTEIIATDHNQVLLDIAKTGTYPADKIKKYILNYEDSGGKADINELIEIRRDSFVIRDIIKYRIRFVNYNLWSGEYLDKFNLIFCRNALIYYNEESQERIIRQFYDWLLPKGVLCLGEKESFQFYSISDRFRNIAGKEKVYQKYK